MGFLYSGGQVPKSAKEVDWVNKNFILESSSYVAYITYVFLTKPVEESANRDEEMKKPCG